MTNKTKISKHEYTKILRRFKAEGSNCDVVEYERIVYGDNGEEIFHTTDYQPILLDEYGMEYFCVPNLYYADELPYTHTSFTDNLLYNADDMMATLMAGGGDIPIYQTVDMQSYDSLLMSYNVKKYYVAYFLDRKHGMWRRTHYQVHPTAEIGTAYRILSEYRVINFVPAMYSVDDLMLALLDVISQKMNLNISDGSFTVDDIFIDYTTLTPLIQVNINTDGVDVKRMLRVPAISIYITPEIYPVRDSRIPDMIFGHESDNNYFEFQVKQKFANHARGRMYYPFMGSSRNLYYSWEQNPPQ